jgi:hypothetical protein
MAEGRALNWWPFPGSREIRAFLVLETTGWLSVKPGPDGIRRPTTLRLQYQGTRDKLEAAGLWHPRLDRAPKGTLRLQPRRGLRSASLAYWTRRVGRHRGTFGHLAFELELAKPSDTWTLERLRPPAGLVNSLVLDRRDVEKFNAEDELRAMGAYGPDG